MDHIIEPLRKHAVPVKSLYLDPANAHPEKICKDEAITDLYYFRRLQGETNG